MKKLLSLLLVLSLIFTLAACSRNTDTNTSERDAADEVVDMVEEQPGMDPVESQPTGGEEPGDSSEEALEEDVESQAEAQQTAAAAGEASQPAAEPAHSNDAATTGKILVVYFSHTNTTATVAGHITGAIEADVFVIEPTSAYPSDYNTHLEVAQQELNDDVRPAIQSTVSNMDEYNTILLGYPIWWGYAPRPVATFLESYDLSGKTIAPFCTSGSSGMGRSADEIARLTPGAEVAEGLSITSSNTGNAENLVRGWLEALGLL